MTLRPRKASQESLSSHVGFLLQGKAIQEQTKEKKTERKEVLFNRLRSVIAFLWIPCLPLCFVLSVVLPSLSLAPNAGSLADSLQQCDEARNVLILPKHRQKLLTFENFSDLWSVGQSLGYHAGDSENRWLHVVHSNTSLHEARVLDSEWVLAYFLEGAVDTLKVSVNVLPQEANPVSNRGWGVGPWESRVLPFIHLTEMGPDGVLTFMNETLRKQLPVTAIFAHPYAGRNKPGHTRFESHYATVVLALILSTFGAALTAVAQLRGLIHNKMDRAVLWYFLLSWLSSGLGGLGYQSWACLTEESYTAPEWVILFIVVGYPAAMASNVQLQWIVVYKMELGQTTHDKCRKLRNALRVEHYALAATALCCLAFLSSLANPSVAILLLGLIQVMLVIVTVADLIFSGHAILAYIAPLQAVGSTLANAKLSLEEVDHKEIQKLQRAYFVAVLNLGATVFAVISTTTAYACLMSWNIVNFAEQVPEWTLDYSMRVTYFDSVVNDICTIIFADLLFLHLPKGMGTEQRTLWAISKVGMHAALRQEEHEEQQRQLIESLNALAEGPNPELSQQMANLETELRVLNLERFMSSNPYDADAPAAERVFTSMQNAANSELRRLMELVNAVTSSHQRASTRFEYLLQIDNFPAGEEGVRQALPDGLQKPRWEGNVDDNDFVMKYLYAMADVMAPTFGQRVSTLVDAFNAAKHPIDLGLDPDEFHFRIFAIPGTSALQVWGPKKTEARAWQKVRTDYVSRDFPQASCLLDIERMMISFPDPYALSIFYAFLVKDGSLPVVRVKNRFLGQDKSLREAALNDDLEYRDVLVNVNVDGFIVEIQLALQHLAELKSCMHPFYKVARASSYEDVATHPIFSKPHAGQKSMLAQRFMPSPPGFLPNNAAIPCGSPPLMFMPSKAQATHRSPPHHKGDGEATHLVVLPGEPLS